MSLAGPDEVFDAAALDTLLDMIGGDPAALSELIESFLDEGPGLIGRVEKAAADADADALRQAAHTMKSSAADFGAMELARLCREMEMLGRAGRMDGAKELAAEAAASWRAAAAALHAYLKD